jgi:hypothetical protein
VLILGRDDDMRNRDEDVDVDLLGRPSDRADATGLLFQRGTRVPGTRTPNEITSIGNTPMVAALLAGDDAHAVIMESLNPAAFDGRSGAVMRRISEATPDEADS